MSENPTPTPPERNPSSEPIAPTSRRELRAEGAAAAAQPAPVRPAPDAAAQPEATTPVPPAPVPPAAYAPEQEYAFPADPSANPQAAQPAAYPGAQQPAAYPGAPQPGIVPPPAAQSAPAEPGFGPANPPLATPPVLDEGTFDRIREPLRQGLALDGTWHQISKKYVISQVVQYVFWIAVVLVGAAVVTTASGEPWAWIPAGVISLANIVSLIFIPRQAKALGYMLRGDDIVFRKGIVWQRMVAVPYGRMQLIDITHGPLDRVFGVSKLKMVTAAASTGIEIPGLTTAGAEALRDTLIEVAETRRTGL